MQNEKLWSRVAGGFNKTGTETGCWMLNSPQRSLRTQRFLDTDPFDLAPFDRLMAGMVNRTGFHGLTLIVIPGLTRDPEKNTIPTCLS